SRSATVRGGDGGLRYTLPDAGGGVCVSTVSIVCGRDGGLPERARWPADHLLNAIQEDRARRFKQHLLVVAIEPPYGEPAAACQPAQRVGESQMGKLERLSNASKPLLAAIISSRSSRKSERTGAALGSIRALSSLERTVLAEPCSPDIAKSG